MFSMGNYLVNRAINKRNAENEQKQREMVKKMAEATRNTNTSTNTSTKKVQASPTINPAYQYKNKDEDLGTMEITDKKPPTTNGEDKGGGYGGGYSGGYTPTYANFQPSQSYLKAMEYTNSLLEQLSSGRTSYTDKVQSMLSAIENHAPFQYDMNTDTLFQNSLQSAMNSGQIAMQDTMGQASALTGGYGSSYAQSVGNQAYNGFIQDAYDKLPDYYNLALNAYDREMQNLYNQLDMYNTQDQIEYDRLSNAYSANLQSANSMYDREYNDYWNKLNFDTSQRQYASDQAYKYAKLAQDQANWEKEYELDLINAQKKQESADAKASELKNPTSKQYETGLLIANKYGHIDDVDGEFQKWADSLPEDVDTTQIYDYVKSKMDSPEYYIADDRKKIKGRKDNLYANQWGDEYEYDKLLELGLLTDEEIKKLKKKN